MEGVAPEAAAAMLVLNIMGAVAARAIEEDKEMSDAEETPVWGGSRPGRAPNKSRDFSQWGTQEGH